MVDAIIMFVLLTVILVTEVIVFDTLRTEQKRLRQDIDILEKRVSELLEKLK